MAQPAVERPAPVPGQFTPLGIDTAPHSAFPAAVRLPDGRVRLAWRESSGHLATDGRTMTAVGDPVTGQWSTPTEVVLDTVGPGRDMRPGALALIDGKVVLTYFYSVNSIPQGAYYAISDDGGATYGTSVRIDGGRPYAAASAPMVKIGSKLVIPWYGRNTGETIDTVWISQSMDNGQTWQPNRIVNGLTTNHVYTEPWALVRGTTLMLLYRDGTWDALGMRVTRNGDAAAPTWDTPRDKVITNATGNSASVWGSNGVIYLTYRSTTSRSAELIASDDNGATWWPQGQLMKAPANLGKGSVGMTYAAPIELGNGLIFCPLGMETSLDTSRLYVGWL